MGSHRADPNFNLVEIPSKWMFLAVSTTHLITDRMVLNTYLKKVCYRIAGCGVKINCLFSPTPVVDLIDLKVLMVGIR